MGSEDNPIEVPSRDNTTIGDRKVFKLILKRSEPIPSTGEFTREVVDFSNIDFPTVDSYVWSYLRSSARNNINANVSINTFLSNYETKIQNDLSVNSNYCPFLENIYTVYSQYYTSEIFIRINVRILVKYPNTDPLSLYSIGTKHSYTIYLKTVKEIP